MLKYSRSLIFAIVMGLSALPCAIADEAFLDETLIKAIEKDDVQAVSAALQQGLDPKGMFKIGQGQDGYYTCPLYIAAENDALKVARLLISSGAEPNTGIRVPLWGATCAKHPQMVRLLIEMGADVNQKHKDSEFGMVPLERAISDNSLEIADILLQHGALSDRGAEFLAAAESPEMKALLRKYGAKEHVKSDLELLLDAIRANSCGEVVSLIDRGVDINAAIEDDNYGYNESSYGRHPLWYAVFCARDNDTSEIIELLLKRGAHDYEEAIKLADGDLAYWTDHIREHPGDRDDYMIPRWQNVLDLLKSYEKQGKGVRLD